MTLDKTNFLSSFVSKMKEEKLPPLIIDTFIFYYQQILAGETGLLRDKDIHPVRSDEIAHAEKLRTYGRDGKQALKHAVMIVLNGGLGTSMGLVRAKSLLPVKNGRTFLDIILRQAESSDMKLAFMNSYNTDADTLAAIADFNPSRLPQTFQQHKFPKILQDNLAPATWEADPTLEWNPPGHGDIYAALQTSGLLERLIEEDVRYAMIRNSDNLGATMDPALLGFFAKSRCPFMMEVAERTPADAKGGHLARHQAGHLILREAAQCPREEMQAFQDIQGYRFFNTNTIWVRLDALQALIRRERIIKLPIILNPKTLDPRNADSPKVYQVETAMGAAVSLFDGATAVRVPRSRFLPVKKCNDLLALRSDRFIFSEDGVVTPNPGNASAKINIQLDPRFFGQIDDFEARFAKGIPSLVDCESLTVEGDVRFGAGITIKGQVTIKNTGDTPVVIEDGALIESDRRYGP